MPPSAVSLTLGKNKKKILRLDVSLHSGTTDESSNLAFDNIAAKLRSDTTPKTVCRKVLKKRSGTPRARLFPAKERELPCIGKWDGVGRRRTKKALWRMVKSSPNVSAT